MAPSRPDEIHSSKTIFALSVISTAFSLAIIVISSLTNIHLSGFNVHFLKAFTIAIASLTLVCNVVLFVVELGRRQRRDPVGADKAAHALPIPKIPRRHVIYGCPPRTLAWTFFLLAVAWIMQFCFLVIVPGGASRPATRREMPDSGVAWNIPAELCLSTLEIVVLAVIAGINRVRHCRQPVETEDDGYVHLPLSFLRVWKC